jgi:type II secretory pathway predicted ATPase ExeA
VSHLRALQAGAETAQRELARGGAGRLSALLEATRLAGCKIGAANAPISKIAPWHRRKSTKPESARAATIAPNFREDSDDRRSNPLTGGIAHSSLTQGPDPASFIVRARHELLRQLIDRILQGERFLALSGAPGTGKTVMARELHDELLSRTVTVFRVERGENDSVGSRSIICQLLHKPEATFQPDDVETLYDTLAIAEDHGQRRAIIIDDAERLRPDALQYLRLVSNMLPEQMPPVVFIGRSSFWDASGQPGRSDAYDLISCRLELERLSDEEAHAFIRERLPDAAGPQLDDARREALVRHADGSIGRLAALLTTAPGMSAAADMPGDRQADRQEATLMIDEPASVTTPASALTTLPTSDIVLNPVAVSPPFERAKNSARLPTVVFHLTAAALMLTVVGAFAYWRLTVQPGQVQTAANSAAPAPVALSGVEDIASPPEPPVKSSPAADPALGPSGPLPLSIPPALTAPAFRAISTDDADQPPAPMAAELSVALSGGAETEWLALDSISADQSLILSSAPARQPPQSPANRQPPTGTEPAAPLAQTAAVPDKPSEAVPAPTAAVNPPPAADNALAAAPAPPDPGANIQPSTGEPQAQTAAVPNKPSEAVPAPTAAVTPPPAADNALAAAPAPPDPGANIQPSTGEPQAQTAAVPDKLSEHVPVLTATPIPPPADVVASPPAVPAIQRPVPGIAASPSVPAAPSGSSLAVPPSAGLEQLLTSPRQLSPQQSATAALPPVAVPNEMPATLPQVPLSATAPVAPTASVGNSAASLPIPELPRSRPPAAPVASAPQLDLGLLLSRGNAMLALGDISAARLFYERAAALGSAGAATALGNTYDAAFLASIQAKGIVADQAAALVWYRKAAALGDTEAARQLNRLAPAR